MDCSRRVLVIVEQNADDAIFQGFGCVCSVQIGAVVGISCCRSGGQLFSELISDRSNALTDSVVQSVITIYLGIFDLY